jgi:meso-butanediol dehydrogenase / (S,S)-butanediol dehydrogenase / diacetyl reductase
MTQNTYAVAGKAVLVTGGGSGIGRAIARAFLDNGAKVAVCGRRAEPLEETLSGYESERVVAVTADVADAEGAAAAVDAVIERFGGLDVLVSNAAAYANGELLDLAEEDWIAIRSTNIDGFVHLARRALPELERRGGNLVAVSSVSGDYGDWGQAAYNASKHAINGFVRSLALDYGSRGVRINAVAPAFTVTDITAEAAEDEAMLAALANRVALGRPGQPEDVAPAVLWLASEDASYVTGAILAVDGGTSAASGQAHLD